MKKIALIIGHSKKSQGACNESSGMTEFRFNEPLAMLVADSLIEKDFFVDVVYRDGGYSELPETVNLTDADIAISMHCNAFNEMHNGTETLYYAGSEKGKKLASFMQGEIVSALGLSDRGLKPCVAAHVGSAGDRGGYLLKSTKMPCVIVEPFFIDCDESLALARDRFGLLADAYVNAIIKYFKV